ncbi:hypothetical protein [Lactonifactor longoviformis]|uniref:hypothetical protein n=1 Tax=Lactonifactor longoviformis TaxID=341220 RepID=UPI001A9A33B8|nr:hypothetical protein [Lactonifactor longoviformis]
MGFNGAAFGLRLKVFLDGRCRWQGDGERKPAAAGWLVRAGGSSRGRFIRRGMISSV